MIQKEIQINKNQNFWISQNTMSHIVSLFLIFCSSLAISWYACTSIIVSFDGAFNASAAINLYNNGSLLVDYFTALALQTNLPYQIINGGMIELFGQHFWVLSLATCIFVGLLALLFAWLSLKSESPLLFSISFATLVFSPYFVAYGFGGYGEFPALLFSLLGGAILSYCNLPRYFFLAGVFFALSITTKTVLLLLVPSFLFLIYLRRSQRRSIYYFIIGFILTFILLVYFQYKNYPRSVIIELFPRVIQQGVPGGGKEFIGSTLTISDYVTRLKLLWEQYSMLTGLEPWGAIYRFVLWLIILSAVIFNHLDKETRYVSTKLFLLFLFISLTIYLFWGIFLNSRWWGRRLFNTEILLFTALPLLFVNSRFKSIGYISILPLFMWNSSYFYYLNYSSNLPKNEELQQNLENCLEKVPKNANFFAAGPLSAPHWAFLSDKKMQNILTNSLYKTCLHNKCQNYLFTQPASYRHDIIKEFINENYRKDLVCSFNDYAIYRILGYNFKDNDYSTHYNLSSSSTYNSVFKINPETVKMSWGSPIAIPYDQFFFFQKNKNCSALEIVIDAEKSEIGREVRIGIWEGKSPFNSHKLTPGINKLSLNIENQSAGSKFIVAILFEPKNYKRPEFPLPIQADYLKANVLSVGCSDL